MTRFQVILLRFQWLWDDIRSGNSLRSWYKDTWCAEARRVKCIDVETGEETCNVFFVPKESP